MVAGALFCPRGYTSLFSEWQKISTRISQYNLLSDTLIPQQNWKKKSWLLWLVPTEKSHLLSYVVRSMVQGNFWFKHLPPLWCCVMIPWSCSLPQKSYCWWQLMLACDNPSSTQKSLPFFISYCPICAQGQGLSTGNTGMHTVWLYSFPIPRQQSLCSLEMTDHEQNMDFEQGGLRRGWC